MDCYKDALECSTGNALCVFKFEKDARAPTRGTTGSAGYDLYAGHPCVIDAGGKALVKTNCGFILPRNTYGRIAGRSGLSWKKHTDVAAGVVDPDYRGNVGVVLFNHGREPVIIHKHDRVAQLILETFVVAEEVRVYDRPPPQHTERGAGGYGSTGR